MSIRQTDYKDSYDSLAEMRARLEKLGSLANQNRMGNVPKFATPANAAYVQADQQALIDAFNRLLDELQRQGIMAPAK